MSTAKLAFWKKCYKCPNRKAGCQDTCPAGIAARKAYDEAMLAEKKRNAVSASLYAQKGAAVNRSTNRGTRRFNYR